MMNDTATPVDQTVDTSGLLKCYVLLAIGLPMTFVQLSFLSGIALIMMLIGIIWAYRLRKRPGELFANHGSWMVRTFWISSLYFILATVLWAAVFSANADKSAIEPMIAGMKAGTAAPEDIQNAMWQFQNTNKWLLLWSLLGCYIFPVVHAVARFIKGYRAAYAGRGIDNLKTWWF
jgi:uncharacterized membrane protein